jgi:hypothetical protein
MVSSRALLGAGEPMESAGCRVKLKSPPSKIECESAESKAGSSVRKKHSLCVLLDVPDGEYTFMRRVPWNSAAMARPNGILSIALYGGLSWQ